MPKIKSLVQQVYPMEASEPNGLIATCRLKTYQKQSLAFMINRENGTHDPDWVPYCSRRVPYRTLKLGAAKCGLLCDEVGMGKTLVFISLILANPSEKKMMTDDAFNRVKYLAHKVGIPPKPIPGITQYLPASMQQVGQTRKVSERNAKNQVKKQIQEGHPLAMELLSALQQCEREEKEVELLNETNLQQNKVLYKKRRKDRDYALDEQKFSVKTTIISTSATLVRQMYNEIKKWAPNLVVKVYHDSFDVNHKDRFKDATDDIRYVEVLITVTATTAPFDYTDPDPEYSGWTLPFEWTFINFHRIIVDEIQGKKCCREMLQHNLIGR